MVNITIKDAAAIERMRAAGRIVAEVLEEIGGCIKAGITTAELNALADDLIRE